MSGLNAIVALSITLSIAIMGFVPIIHSLPQLLIQLESQYFPVVDNLHVEKPRITKNSNIIFDIYFDKYRDCPLDVESQSSKQAFVLYVRQKDNSIQPVIIDRIDKNIGLIQYPIGKNLFGGTWEANLQDLHATPVGLFFTTDHKCEGALWSVVKKQPEFKIPQWIISEINNARID